ncbi:DUF262 domain-containing protein [Streptomyces sp. BE282]|uniref:DUF262 domain-containing protein n=1 Tax=Streptomyces sp. BE282 TaxID=3002527 RepID=UPI002E795C4A|nr:DUF262 domain-containing protein [Streptomyces sp. BE282]MEE1734031.1 DUF262 domain-containing protein [Streptomyces sp. BE282]MEE1734818.1 DUF262 domain-containing protein [Streptomyces sp. BE282]
MDLEEEIEMYRRKIATDTYPMSIGELSNLYRDGEIDIHPEFQRIFRWESSQRSRLIESVILGIPLPSVFVAQNEKGVWDVVDGVQRMSTIFQFMGILKDENNEPHDPLICSDTPFLTQLEGCSFEPHRNSIRSLSATQRLDFKRARIDMKIIKRESDNRAKYDLFQRLNSFGSMATPQELRNCLLVSLSKKHYEWLAKISSDESFLKVIDLPRRLIKEQYHMELALRFIFLRKIDSAGLASVGNIGDFLAYELVQFVEWGDARLEGEREAFVKTFDILLQAGGPDMLRRFNPERNRTEGPFSLTAFEAIALGVGFHLPGAELSPEAVHDRRASLWSNDRFTAGHASGMSSDQRMKRTIPFGRSLLSV